MGDSCFKALMSTNNIAESFIKTPWSLITKGFVAFPKLITQVGEGLKVRCHSN